MENASTVAKRGEPAIFPLNLVLIRSVATRRRPAPILVSSKAHAAFATKKTILPLNVLTNPNPNVTTARKKVSITPHIMPYRPFLTRHLGHQASGCKANRVLDKSRVADMSAEDAWEALVNADEQRDLEEFREAGADKGYFRIQNTDFHD